MKYFSLVALALVAACGTVASGPIVTPPEEGRIMMPSDSSAPLPTVAPIAIDNILVTLEQRGGFCMGPCVNVETIAVDGTITRTDQQGTHAGGTVLPERLEAIKAAIATADFAALAKQPLPPEFTCPVAYDGTESVFTFHVDGKTYELASCATFIDPDSPPFVEVQDALADQV